jgi:hypothetical protein
MVPTQNRRRSGVVEEEKMKEDRTKNEKKTTRTRRYKCKESKR